MRPRNSSSVTALLLAPFAAGGLAGAWLAVTSAGFVTIAIGWGASALAAAAIALLVTSAPSGARPRRGRLPRAGARRRWHAHPIWSFGVRSLAVLAPIGVSVATALAIQRLLPSTSGGWSLMGRALAAAAGGFAVLYAAERGTRRLRPIAMLLRLSLAFPDAAPSRFRIARRSGNPEALRSSLEGSVATEDRSRTDIAATLLSLLAALWAHDPRSRRHSDRVHVFAEMLAEELNLDPVARERLRWSSLLHDIGKLAVATDILNKRGRLDDDQRREMRRHPGAGAELVRPLARWLTSAVVQHHEHLDGSGYPHGLEGRAISPDARIIAVADAFDTMVARSSYRGAMTPAAAMKEVARFSGSRFDPHVVGALESVSILRLSWRIGLRAWLAQLPVLMRGRLPQLRRMPVRGALRATGVLAALGVLGAVWVLGPRGALAPPVDGGSQVQEARETTQESVGGDPASGAVTTPEPKDDSRGERSRGPSNKPDPEPRVAEPSGGAPIAPATQAVGSSGGTQGGGGSAGAAGGGESGRGGGGGGSVGGAGDAGSVDVAGGEGTVVEANSDATFAGAGDQPVGTVVEGNSDATFVGAGE